MSENDQHARRTSQTIRNDPIGPITIIGSASGVLSILMVGAGFEKFGIMLAAVTTLAFAVQLVREIARGF